MAELKLALLDEIEKLRAACDVQPTLDDFTTGETTVEQDMLAAGLVHAAPALIRVARAAAEYREARNEYARDPVKLGFGAAVVAVFEAGVALDAALAALGEEKADG